MREENILDQEFRSQTERRAKAAFEAEFSKPDSQSSPIWDCAGKDVREAWRRWVIEGKDASPKTSAGL